MGCAGGKEGNNRLQTLRRESQQSLTLVKLKGEGGRKGNVEDQIMVCKTGLVMIPFLTIKNIKYLLWPKDTTQLLC